MSWYILAIIAIIITLVVILFGVVVVLCAIIGTESMEDTDKWEEK